MNIRYWIVNSCSKREDCRWLSYMYNIVQLCNPKLLNNAYMFSDQRILAILGKIHDDAIIYTDLYMKVAKGRQSITTRANIIVVIQIMKLEKRRLACMFGKRKQLQVLDNIRQRQGSFILYISNVYNGIPKPTYSKFSHIMCTQNILSN